MEKPVVNCSVANCKFWEDGNKCTAESILIEIDAHANRDYKMETGHIVGEDMHQDKAGSIKETCCHTFRPKNK